jgi:hypothetical protein
MVASRFLSGSNSSSELRARERPSRVHTLDFVCNLSLASHAFGRSRFSRSCRYGTQNSISKRREPRPVIAVTTTHGRNDLWIPEHAGASRKARLRDGANSLFGIQKGTVKLAVSQRRKEAVVATVEPRAFGANACKDCVHPCCQQGPPPVVC